MRLIRLMIVRACWYARPLQSSFLSVSSPEVHQVVGIFGSSTVSSSSYSLDFAYFDLQFCVQIVDIWLD